MIHKCRQVLSLIICLFMIFNIFIGNLVIVKASDVDITGRAPRELLLKDIEGHWARQSILSWMEKGLVNGYPEGIFKPDDSITRAEFMTMVNKAFGFKKLKAVNFTDVLLTDWYAKDIEEAVAERYVTGYEDGSIEPQILISRQEAAVILCKVLKLDLTHNTDILNKFKDVNQIPQWSKPYLSTAVKEGYINGFPNGTCQPAKSITRAESITILSRAVGALFNAEGIYGDENKTNEISENVTITSDGVTLKNIIINGNLFLASSIGDGDVTLEDVIVKGKTIVSGGGEDSIHFTNFTGKEIKVVKASDSIRIVTAGDTSIDRLLFESSGYIEGEGVEEIFISKPGKYITLDGYFEKVMVQANVEIKIADDTTIENMEITDTGAGAEIYVNEDAIIKQLIVNAPISILGEGRIEEAEINVNGVKSEIKLNKLIYQNDVRRSPRGDGVKKDDDEKTVDKSELRELTETARELKAEDYTEETWGAFIEILLAVEAVLADEEATQEEVDSALSALKIAKGNLQKIIRVESISLKPNTVTLAVYEAVYQEATITAVIYPEDAYNKNVIWTSSNENVAIVISKDNQLSALVKAIGVGETLIKVETYDGRKTDICLVTVGHRISPIEYAYTDDANLSVDVAYNTTEADAKAELIKVIGITGSNGEKGIASIDWTIIDYNGHVPGEYLAIGRLTLPPGWVGEPLDVTAIVTVVPESDTIPPKLEGVTPAEGKVELAHDENFILTVYASDVNLYELEINHNLNDLPKFRVYASENDPYGGQGEAFQAKGVSVNYDAEAQKWTIDFGEEVTNTFVAKGNVELYMVIKDLAGNAWGSMDNITDENTFVYTVTRQLDPVEKALNEVNAYLTEGVYKYFEAPGTLEAHLAALGLEIGEGSDYDKLETVDFNHKTAVFYDLYQNKPARGYDLDTLTIYFNDMVATMLVIQASIDKVNTAKNIEDLKDISFMTMMLERFHLVSYGSHSNIPVEERIETLENLVTRYNALDEDEKTTVLQILFSMRPEGGYALSQDIIDALAKALTEVEVIQYFDFDKKTGTITGYDVAGGLDVIIPSMIDGVAVKHIGEKAFHFKRITSVVIPESVVSIGNNAFNSCAITSVIIPDSVLSIGAHAFNYCKLNKLILSNNISTIEKYAFANNQLTDVTVPASVESIGEHAFYNNDLISITFCGNGIRIGNSAFLENSLTKITIGAGAIIENYLLTNNNYFRTAYTAGGAGTYIGTQTGKWTKVEDGQQ